MHWDGHNPVPPEMWLLPDWLPFHPGRLWCHCRMVYLPMCYLYGTKFTYAHADTDPTTVTNADMFARGARARRCLTILRYSLDCLSLLRACASCNSFLFFVFPPNPTHILSKHKQKPIPYPPRPPPPTSLSAEPAARAVPKRRRGVGSAALEREPPLGRAPRQLRARPSSHGRHSNAPAAHLGNVRRVVSPHQPRRRVAVRAKTSNAH